MSAANHIVLIAGMGTSSAVQTETVWARGYHVRFSGGARVVVEGW